MSAVIHYSAAGVATDTCVQSIFYPPQARPFPQLRHCPSKPPPQPGVCSLSPSRTLLSLPKSNPQLVPYSATSATQFLPKLHPSASNAPPLKNHEPPANDYFSWLRLSVRYSDVELAKAVHASVLKLEEDTQLSNALIFAYLKLGLMAHAQGVFLSLSCPDVVSYTSVISGFAKSSREPEAVEFFFEMRGSGIEPNEFSFVAILTACIRLADLDLGFQIHSLAIKMGYAEYTFVCNALMGLYGKCGCLDFVFNLFDEMPQRDIASWNTVLACFVKDLRYDKAFEYLRDMQRCEGYRVDQFTLSILLSASSGGLAWMGGREIHAHLLRIGFECNLSVNNALIGFYTRCGSAKDVVTLFERMPVKDIFTWTEMITAYMEFGAVDLAVETFDKMPEKNCVSYNALMAGYCGNGRGSNALRLFVEMVEEGVELNEATLTSVINACGLLMEVMTSEQIHGFVLKFGFRLNSSVETALLDMYTRCGRMDEAEKMFIRVPSNKNSPIAWTSMICGYSRNGQPEEAISLFCQGLSGDMIVDEVALASVLGVSGTLGLCMIGKQIHCHTLKLGFWFDIGLANATMSMYYKCGNMEDAFKVFSNMSTHDTVSWNSLVAGYVLHRQGDKALHVWSEMEKAGLQPDAVTFLLVISAYRHTNSNLVDDCRKLFLSMETIYGIQATAEHYASLIGVFGYWGLFEEAEELIGKMPFEPEASVWRALLDTCRIRLNTNLGKLAAKRILALEPQDPSTYILISNLYSASGRWHCSETVREDMRQKGLQKLPGRSWIIHQSKVHSFYARDKSHCHSKDIYRGLEILILESMKAGYVPDTSFVLQEVEEHQKKEFLFYHSAKLAITHGLLTTKPGKPIRIMKNILLCGDCHTFLKYVSIVTKREIHVRDSSGFHRFLNGQCSCKDYW